MSPSNPLNASVVTAPRPSWIATLARNSAIKASITTVVS